MSQHRIDYLCHFIDNLDDAVSLKVAKCIFNIKNASTESTKYKENAII